MITDEPAVGICVVTFRRPRQLINMLLQIKERTLYANYKVYIIIDYEDDGLTLKALEENGVAEKINIERIEMFLFSVESVKAINRCYSIGKEPYFVWLSDDMEVEKGWLQKAMKCMQASLNGNGMVTFHDGIQNGKNACAGLISRNYIKAELGGIFQNEVYIHFYADSELSRKSEMRGKSKYCSESIVWHNHWGGKGSHRGVQKDGVYIQSGRWRKRDRAVFVERKKDSFLGL